jgi:hypothetical protein
MTHQQAIDGMASERYQLDEMSEIERFEFEAHYFDCTECAEEVRLAHMIRDEAALGAASPTTNVAPDVNRTPTDVVSGFSRTPAKILPFWRRPMQAVPWAAAAGLALMVSYQSLVTVPGLKDSIAPEPLAPVMLRGATRGTVPVVPIESTQHFVTLAVDVMSATSTGTLRYELVHAGHAVLSGDAPLPANGAPLMLVVPAVELEHHSRYSLIVRSADSANAVIGEYDFDVS